MRMTRRASKMPERVHLLALVTLCCLASYVQARTASSCSNLGWDPIERGNDLVCGGAPDKGTCENKEGCDDDPNSDKPPCSLKYAESKSVCDDAGARLCTRQEIADKEVTQISEECGYENSYIW